MWFSWRACSSTSALNWGLWRDLGVDLTSTISLTPCTRNNSTNSSIVRVEWPTVKIQEFFMFPPPLYAVTKPSTPLGQRRSTGTRVRSAALTMAYARSILILAINPSQTNRDILRKAHDDAIPRLNRMTLHLNKQHPKWRFR